MGFGQVILLAFLFQIAPVNQEHPPVQIMLNHAEKAQLAKVPSYKFDESDEAKKVLIELHQPKPKASWKPCTAGYHGRIYRPEDIIYTWEVPKCVK